MSAERHFVNFVSPGTNADVLVVGFLIGIGIFLAGELTASPPPMPVIPTIPWFNLPSASRAPGFNAQLAELKTNYPQILNGPDFWTYFSENQHLISADNLHPSNEGYLVYRRVWAETMLEVVYSLLFDGFEPGNLSRWSDTVGEASP